MNLLKRGQRRNSWGALTYCRTDKCYQDNAIPSTKSALILDTESPACSEHEPPREIEDEGVVKGSSLEYRQNGLHLRQLKPHIVPWVPAQETKPRGEQPTQTPSNLQRRRVSFWLRSCGG